MSLFELAIIIMIAVVVLAPISIYFMLKYYALELQGHEHPFGAVGDRAVDDSFL